MAKVLVIVPFALDAAGIENRRLQLDSVTLGPDIEFDFRGVKAGPAILDCYHDYLLGDIALFEAAMSAQDDGYDAVCIDTMSDSGMNAMRSVLDIPVIGPGRACYLMALMMGNKFSIVTQWDGWIPLYKKTAQEYGMSDRLVSVRSINVMPDVANLLGGKEEVVFPKLVDCATQCIEHDGAEVILLSNNGDGREGGNLWEPFIRTRALDNQVHIVAAVNSGRSCVISPKAEVLCMTDRTPGAVASAECDLNASVTDFTGRPIRRRYHQLRRSNTYQALARHLWDA